VLVSSHQLEQLGRVADQVAIMHEGVIVRHFGQHVVTAPRLLRLELAQGGGDELGGLIARFPGAWRAGNTLNLPWQDDLLDENAFRESLPRSLSAGRVTLEEVNMERLFLEAIQDVKRPA
jgi:hypothetical protein